MPIILVDGKLRRLTPKECWRLQGFTDEQFDKAKDAGLSDTQLYKQAGNAVSVPVVYDIGKRLLFGNRTNRNADRANYSSNR